MDVTLRIRVQKLYQTDSDLLIQIPKLIKRHYKTMVVAKVDIQDANVYFHIIFTYQVSTY